MNVLLDTNILLRSVQVKHPMHTAADAAVTTILGAKDTPCLVAQSFYEFWVVGTRPLGQNGLGLSPKQIETEFGKFKNPFAMHDDTPAIRPTWEQLVVKYQVIGKNAHDARLVAAMIVHKIPRILTFNMADFQRFTEVETVAPAVVTPSN